MAYPFKDIEKKWQAEWAEAEVYAARDLAPKDKAKKYYGLIEFPYPSGEGLHVGHPRSYVALDIMTRKKRMEGRDVLYPIGWDAFGLPTENFAIKHKVKPADATAKNVANFTRQLKSLGLGFDWSREINTTDPGYYRWTQWMFLKFFDSYFDDVEGRAKPIELLAIPDNVAEQGEVALREYRDARRMAYKSATTINWCPRCKIGLANEEAQGGACERCSTPVEQRTKAQWMLRMTKYADRLIKDLDSVDYLEKITSQQIDWIGKSEGAYIDFAVIAKSLKSEIPAQGRDDISCHPALDAGSPEIASSLEAPHDGNPFQDKITVFTTRPDTLFGATYVVLAPEHPLVDAWIKQGLIANEKEVTAYREGAKLMSDLERQENKLKTGVELKGLRAKNPATGEELPVWIADYVLAGYGTGSIMAVPAHDERDFEFAVKFNLPIKLVVEPVTGEKHENEEFRRSIVAILRDPKNDTLLSINWGKENGGYLFVGGGMEEGEDPVIAATREIAEETGYVDVKLVAQSEKIHHHYVAWSKKKNRDIEAVGLLFDLVTDERVEPKLEENEQGKFSVEWLAPEEADRRVGDALHRYVFDKFIKGKCYVGDGIAVNSDLLDGLETAEAKEKIIQWLEDNACGSRTTNYKLRDWVFSRQRYWGEPIPIVNCPKCGFVPVPDEALPVTLPDVAEYEPTDTGESPLAAMRAWVETTCPVCGGPAERETDTMPNWAGSSWYYLRYADPHNDKAFAAPDKLKFWLPVDLYNGGMEHATRHLLYSRFWHKFLWDIGVIPKECGAEPYLKRRAQALILGEGGIKMSKSKGNVVNPDEVVEEYGADVFRLYEMFIGPFDADAPWDTNGIEGVRRFLEKVWRLFQEMPNAKCQMPDSLSILLNQTIKKVGEDIEAMHFNTAVSALMILANGLSDVGAQGLAPEVAEPFLKILAPFAPHLTDELWHKLGHKKTIHLEAWPEYDPTKISAAIFELVIQVNGKVRDKLTVPSDISEDEAKKLALESEKIKPYLADNKPKQIVYVKGRLVSIAV